MLSFISESIRDYTNKSKCVSIIMYSDNSMCTCACVCVCVFTVGINEKDCLDTIKLKLSEMVHSWAGLPLTGLNKEINSIVADVNQTEQKYLTIHDSSISSSSVISASALRPQYKHPSSLVPLQSLPLDPSQHKVSSMVVARPKSGGINRQQAFDTKMLITTRDTPLSHIHKYQPISHDLLRHSSSHTKQRPSLPKYSHSASKLRHQKRKSHNQPKTGT